MESMFALLFVCYTAYAYNRKCVAFSMPSLIEEGLDTSYAGLILSCQNIAISGSKFFFGMLSDRINPQRLFVVGLMLTGLTTLLFSSSTSVMAFCIIWFLNGLAQGCGWPSLAKILRQKADPTKFGTLWSLLSSSNNISGCLSPFLAAYLALNYGWRYSLYAAGISSMLLSSFAILTLDSSFQNKSNAKESISKTSTSDKRSDSETTVKTVLKDPFLWMVFVCFMVVFCTKSTLVDWGQLYLKQECGLSLRDGSAFASSIEIGGFLGRLLAGYLTDIFVRRELGKKDKVPSYQIRMSVAVFFLLGSVFTIHMIRTSIYADSSLFWIMSLGFTSGASLYGVIAICGIAASESAPSHLSGTAYALAALGGNVGATLSGFPICFLAAQYSWSDVLLLLECIIGITVVLVFCSKSLRSASTSTKKEE